MVALSKKKYWLGFDLGGTKMMAIVFNESFKKISSERNKTMVYEGKKAVLERILKTINMALQQAGISIKHVHGVGIGCPGPIDITNGIVINAPNLGWKRFPIKEYLKNKLGCQVVVINDVDAAVYGEYRFGSAKGACCAVGMFPGTGVGGGCVYQGKILAGKLISAFEIGHIQVIPRGPLCGCGQRGCLEAVASRLAVSASVAAAAYRGEAPTIIKNTGMDLGNISSQVLLEAVNAGDKVVKEIILEAAHWLGIGVAMVVHLICPDIIVLGGGLVEASPELFCKEVLKTASSRVMKLYRNEFKVVLASLGDDATAMGAAAWAREILHPFQLQISG
ncbi:MAG: ROK family protein [Elusimicrobiota bacterium]